MIEDGELWLDGRRRRIGDYRSAWVRITDISAAAPSPELRQSARDVSGALHRLFSEASIPVINPPLRERSNFSKMFHAVTLGAVAGWKIPMSCLTNKRADAELFIDTCSEGIIFKGASGAKTWATVYDRELHEARLSRLESCPVLFQERIVGPDVRVHVVGQAAFAEQISSPSVDYRIAEKNVYEPIELPDAIKDGAIRLATACRLPMLGIDFKIQNTTGEWFFLEANSMPAYHFYDRRAGGVIAAAVIEWLRHPPC
jgi:glutathione synthase/RimK-type ligase-like ATP-grasp enzyme